MKIDRKCLFLIIAIVAAILLTSAITATDTNNTNDVDLTSDNQATKEKATDNNQITNEKPTTKNNIQQANIKKNTSNKTLKTASNAKKDTKISITNTKNNAVNTTFKVTVKTSDNSNVKSGQVKATDYTTKKTYTATVKNGQAYLNAAPGTTAANRKFTIQYLGDSTYNPSPIITKTINITKAGTNMKIDVAKSNIINTTFKATVKSGDYLYVKSGYVNVYDEYGTKVGYGFLKNGKTSIAITPSSKGYHTYTLKYMGNNIYNPSASINKKVKITNAGTNIKVETLKTTTANTTFKVTVKSGETHMVKSGHVNIYDNYGTKLGYGFLKNGVTTITIRPDPGYQEFNIKYVGNNIYNPSKTISKTIEIIDSSKIATYLYVPSLSANPNSNVYIYPNLYSKIPIHSTSENEIDYDIDNFDVYLNNKKVNTSIYNDVIYSESRDSDEDYASTSYICFKAPSLAGNYTVTIKYKGDGKYQSCSRNVPLTIKYGYVYDISIVDEVLAPNNPKSDILSLTSQYLDGDYYDFVSDGYVEYYFNNKYIGSGNPHEAFTFTTPSKEGYYPIKAIYYDDQGNYRTYDSRLIYVGKIKLVDDINVNSSNIHTNDPVSISVGIDLDEGQYGTEYEVDGYAACYFNNKYIKTQKLSASQSTFNCQIKAPSTAGKYTFKVVYYGSDYFLSYNYTKSIEVKAKTPKISITNNYITNGETLTATVKEGSENVNSGKVTFYMENTNLGSATVSNGKASIKYSSSYYECNYTFTATYTPTNKEYEKATTTKVITIDEGINSYIVTHPIYDNPGEYIIIEATLKHNDADTVHHLMSNRENRKVTLDYYLDGKYIGSTYDYCGQTHYLHYTMPSAGTYNLTVKYSGINSPFIRPSSYTTTLTSTFNKLYDLKVSPYTVPTNNTVYIYASINDEDYNTINSGKIAIYVDNKLVKTQSVKYNHIEFYYKTPTNRGLHNIKAVYIDKYGKEVVVDEHVFKVGIDELKLNLYTPTTLKRGNTYTITVETEIEDYTYYNSVNQGYIKFDLPDGTEKTVKVKDSQASITFYVPYSLEKGDYGVYAEYYGTKYYPYAYSKQYVEIT